MRRNCDYVIWGLICLVVSLVGFWPSYVTPLVAGTYYTPSPMMTWHVLSTFAWLIFLIGQPWFVRHHHIKLHRQIGILGAFIAIAVVATGVIVQLDVMGPYAAAGDRRNAVPIPFIRLTLLLGFTVCVAWAIILRNRPEWHKRLMLLGTFPLLQSAFDRMGANVFGLPDARGLFAIGGHFGLMLLFMLWDRWKQGRFHPATKWVSVALFLFYFFSPAFSNNPLWRKLAAMLANVSE